MLKVPVKRSQWGRGDGVVGSRLFNPKTEKLCCMGFACLAAGLTLKQINDLSTVMSLPHRGIPIPPALAEFHEQQENHFITSENSLYGINDTPAVINREEKLIELGKRCGLDFRFED